MAIAAEFTTFETLPPTTRVVTYAPCPVCGKSGFNARQHRLNHIAKCEREAMAEAEAAGVFECEELGFVDLLPVPLVSRAHHTETVLEYRARTAAERARQPLPAWQEEV